MGRTGYAAVDAESPAGPTVAGRRETALVLGDVAIGRRIEVTREGYR
jgi:hypothetical protein